MSARERILARVRDALEERSRTSHPGPFHGARPNPAPPPIEAFTDLFQRAGGEVVRAATPDQAAAWLRSFAKDFADAAFGAGVPAGLREAVAVGRGARGGEAPPETAALGVSMAWGAVAETGSLVLSATDGRRAQLLPPTHVVVVMAESVHPTLADALRALRPALPSAVGLHSGPSKSADIGQILVRGVHGPGRVVALVIGGSAI